MNKKIAFFIALLGFFSLSISAFALDWIKAHGAIGKKTRAVIEAELAQEPLDLEKLYALGLSCLDNGLDDDAQTVFRKMLNLEPQLLGARWGLAEIARRQGNYSDSNMELNLIIEENPEFAPAYVSLAYLKFTTRNFKPALKTVSKLLDFLKEKIDTNTRLKAYFLIAACEGMLAHNGTYEVNRYRQSDDFPDAFTACELFLDSAQLYFGAGVYFLLAKEKYLNMARDFFQKTLEIDAHYADAYAWLGQIYKIRGDSEQSNMFLDKALEIDPQNFLAADIKSGRF